VFNVKLVERQPGVPEHEGLFAHRIKIHDNNGIVSAPADRPHLTVSPFGMHYAVAHVELSFYVQPGLNVFFVHQAHPFALFHFKKVSGYLFEKA